MTRQRIAFALVILASALLGIWAYAFRTDIGRIIGR